MMARHHRRRLLFAMPAFLWACGATAPQSDSAGLALEISESPPASPPAILELPPPGGDASGLLTTSTQSAAGVLLQAAPAIFSSPGDQITRGFCAILPAGASQGSFPLSQTDIEEGSPFTFQEEPGRLSLLEDGLPVFTYNFGIQESPAAPPDRNRSTYVHPLFDLEGTPLTDDFPTDHFHHRGLSWMWPRVTVSGQTYDLWHIQGLYQRFEDWLRRESGPVCATIGVSNRWQLEDRTVAREWVWVRAFRRAEQGRAIDISLTWKALEPISLLGAEERGYGGLCLRLAPRSGAAITVPTGLLEEDSDLQPNPWADQSGLFEGSQGISGVSIFQHQANPDFPAGWCLRHYGFLGVSWPGLQPFELGTDDAVTVRFRIWVHQGDAIAGQVANAFAGFSGPPAARIVWSGKRP